jgi:hypothetical protein
MESSQGRTAVPAESGAGAWTPIPEQRAIIEAAPQARLLVVAPPGTGKTAVACARVGHLLRNSGVAASNVLIVSFTRTAVAEIRARIEGHVGSGISISATPITTIDSQAWALQYGFSEDGEGSTNWFGSDYGESIDRARELLAKRSPDVVDYLSRFEHVVVDEAQDLVGNRLELVSELIKCLPPTCGVTVFADFLQAIYDFSGERVASDTMASSALQTKLGPEFAEKRLTCLHRFKHEKLATVLTQVRELLESSVLPPAQLRSCVHQLLQRENIVKPVPIPPWKIHEIKGIRNLNDLLILFRSRAQVLCASEALCRQGIAHRIRMSGVPDCMHPWLARVFAGFLPVGLVLARSEFLDRAGARGLHDAEQAWDALLRIARYKNGVDWRRLRALLARPRPPVEACFLDLGTAGPTVGTVHASKGREAKKVLYSMPSDGEDTFEEIRVDYVALTRGSDAIHVGTAAPYGFREKADRIYRFERTERSDTRKARIEVGRAGDMVDERVLDGDSWQLVQDHLWNDRASVRLLSAQKRVETNWAYELAEQVEGRGEIHHGGLSTTFQREVYEIGKSKGWVPQSRLYDVYRVSVRTVVMAQDDRRLGDLPAPVCESGYFLSPVVRGWSRAYFKCK